MTVQSWELMIFNMPKMLYKWYRHRLIKDESSRPSCIYISYMHIIRIYTRMQLATCASASMTFSHFLHPFPWFFDLMIVYMCALICCMPFSFSAEIVLHSYACMGPVSCGYVGCYRSVFFFLWPWACRVPTWDPEIHDDALVKINAKEIKEINKRIVGRIIQLASYENITLHELFHFRNLIAVIKERAPPRPTTLHSSCMRGLCGCMSTSHHVHLIFN